VGPGICIGGQVALVSADGKNAAGAAEQPYPHEYIDAPSGWLMDAALAVKLKICG
jgi:hypothetical protein